MEGNGRRGDACGGSVAAGVLVATQGHVLTAGDFLATLAVEATITISTWWPGTTAWRARRNSGWR